jgi:hypothetical protein
VLNLIDFCLFIWSLCNQFIPAAPLRKLKLGTVPECIWGDYRKPFNVTVYVLFCVCQQLISEETSDSLVWSRMKFMNAPIWFKLFIT